MVLLQLSAAQGPSECCLAVSLASKRLLDEAKEYSLEATCLEEEPSRNLSLLKSALFKIEGENSVKFAKRWEGTMQWICQSPFRPKHKRKNWFFTGSFFLMDDDHSVCQISQKEILFEACRSSGPGGQHANKTSSAIRATHIATGISVKVESERSQHANKRLAITLIEHKLVAQSRGKQAAEKRERRLQHHSIERGNAVRVFKGRKFIEN